VRCCWRIGDHVVASDDGLPAGQRKDAAENAHRGSLARAVGPEKADDLAALDLE